MLAVISWKVYDAITKDNWAGGIQVQEQANTDVILRI
jgi:hypothetical protein